MIKSSIENFAEDIGFDIGNSDDLVQAKMLNGFCRGLTNSIINNHDLNTQICYIVDKLDKKSANVFKAIVEYINLKEKI